MKFAESEYDFSKCFNFLWTLTFQICILNELNPNHRLGLVKIIHQWFYSFNGVWNFKFWMHEMCVWKMWSMKRWAKRLNIGKRMHRQIIMTNESGHVEAWDFKSVYNLDQTCKIAWTGTNSFNVENMHDNHKIM